MFGPNAVPEFHHRSEVHRYLMEDVIQLLKERCGVPKFYEIYFLSGSGTFGLEAVIKSLACSAYTNIPNPEDTRYRFTNRLKQLLTTYTKLLSVSEADIIVYCQYETGCSEYIQDDAFEGDVAIVDCVSAFPYYSIPEGAYIWVTVSGKQLGTAPGLVIVGIDPAAWECVIETSIQAPKFSCLNLWMYRDYWQRKLQTPFTSSISILQQLRNNLQEFNLGVFRHKINIRRRMVQQIIPSSALVGTGPVVTFKPKIFSEREAKAYGFYYSQEMAQIFLWSGTDGEFLIMLQQLKNKLIKE